MRPPKRRNVKITSGVTMMGAGLLFMLVVGLVVIGVPLLIAALIASGGQAKLSKPQTLEPDHSPAPEDNC